jgi:hypothetical protein
MKMLFLVNLQDAQFLKSKNIVLPKKAAEKTDRNTEKKTFLIIFSGYINHFKTTFV